MGRKNQKDCIDAKVKEYIDYAIANAIDEIKKQGLLKESKNEQGKRASKALEDYYAKGMEKEEITKILEEMKQDPYFGIIPLHFKEKLTMESIAERLGCDVSTISRNKKRLCLEFYAKNVR